MSGPVDALSNKLFANTVPVDNIIKKYEEEGEKARGEIQDKIDLRESKLSELAKLQSLTVKIKNVSNVIADPLQTGFDTKTATVVSSENGLSGNDFLKNVRVDNSAINGPTNIAVATVATTSDLIIRTGAANTGFAETGQLNLDGTIRLTLAGNAVDTDVVATDTFDDVLNKINTNIFAGNHEFEVFKLQGANGTAFIEVRAKNTGAASTIAFNYTNNIPLINQTPATTVDQEPSTNGVDADVYINGIRHQQASNKFVNIVPGTSFEVIRQNTLINGLNPVSYANLNKTTISVSEDKSAVKKLIADFGDAMNELSYLVAKNSQSSRSISDVQFSDPTKPFDSFDDPNSPLRGSAILSEATDLFNKLITRRPGTSGNIGTLLDLGFGVKAETKEGDNFSYEKLYFADKALFEKAFEDNFQEVYNYFVTNVKITNGGNTGYVQYVPSDSAKTITDPTIIGHNINLAVTYNNGAVTAVTAAINGANINGTITHDANSNRYNVSFTDTILDGIDFSIDPNGVGNTTENSTIVYKPGLINEVREDIRAILSDDGKSGSSITEGSQIQDKISAYKEELSKTDEEFKKSIEEMRNIESILAIMEQKTNLLLASIEAALGSNQ